MPAPGSTQGHLLLEFSRSGMVSLSRTDPVLVIYHHVTNKLSQNVLAQNNSVYDLTVAVGQDPVWLSWALCPGGSKAAMKVSAGLKSR